MSPAEVSKLSLNQKLLIMEAIWQDLLGRAESLDIPPLDKVLLEGRRARASRGEAAILDWDEVKHMIGRS